LYLPPFYFSGVEFFHPLSWLKRHGILGMMTRRVRLRPFWLMGAAAIALLLPAKSGLAQSRLQKVLPGAPAMAVLTPSGKSAKSTPPQPNRAAAYYHLALASVYENQAATEGRTEYVTRAIEEYKLALDIDPASPQLNNALAQLYFRTGHSREAESTAHALLKSAPDDVDAHRLLGHIYLRALSEGQNSLSATPSPGKLLDQAIGEFEKLVALQPKNLENHLILGQLYGVKHEQKKSEEQFHIAQAIEPDSEEAVLSLARLYAENGNIGQSAKAIEAVPVASRTAKMEDVLGAAYEQLKQTKEATAAYRRAAMLAPKDTRTLEALAQSLLNDNQFDEALTQYQKVVELDPENVNALVHIGEIQRRQGKFEQALETIRTAREKDPENLEAGYNEGLLLDVLGRYDESTRVFEKMVDLISHANGAYTTEEKNNRGIFLERLGTVYQEQNKTDKAIATYQKMIDMGGDAALRGYQFQVETYRDAKQFDKAIEVSRKAIEANPKNRDLKLMLAGELGDQGKTDEGLAITRGMLNKTNEDRTVWLAMGQMLIRAQRWKEAEDAFNKAAALTSKKEDKAYLLFLRGELAERQKHYELAERFFRQVLVLEPDSALTLNYLGFMLADKDVRLPEALKLIHRAVELEPMNGAYLDSLGWVYFKMGEYELAEENLRKAVERDQTDPTLHDHLGELYEKTGRLRLAATEWELSLKVFAKSAPADVEPDEVAKVQRKLESVRVRLAKQESAAGKNKQK
jgi:tetratricopeptide (TPR) repeat protein